MPKLAPELRDQRLLNARTLRAMVLRARALAPAIASTGRSLGHRAVLLMTTMLSAHPALAQNLPQGGVVVGGAASIGQPSANQMLITQSTQRAAINWQSFNIGAGYGVQVVQPSSSAILVNRVIGLSGPSNIAGTLTANGQIYIVNPQGVVFGKGAMVNVGALLATTRDVNVEQFMAGGNVTLAGGSTGDGRVVNRGTIATAPGGYVVLAGDRVINKGTIDTPGGRTVLAAGDQATVALSNGQLVNVTMNAAVANATVKNGGVIKAAGGKVVLSANGANSVLGGAVNVSGAIDVSAALAGDITLDAGPGGTVCASGASLKAASSAGKGGNITLAGGRVGLFNGTRLNASGTTGGGTVKVGGGAHGEDATVRNASSTVIDPTASIDASATDEGDGGTVVVWSNDYTGFYGTITARGGPNGGNGGWIETSSHDNLQALGHVVLGEGGTWLLDPSNVTIANAATSGDNFNSSSGVWVPSANAATINASEINAQLNNGTTVIVTTNSSRSQAGVLTLNADITKTAGGNASLTLRANGTLVDNGKTISSTAGKLNVTMNASDNVVLANGSAFSLNGGNLTIIGNSTANIGVSIGQVSINAAAATITGTTNSGAAGIYLFGTLNASGTQLTLNGNAHDNVGFAANGTLNASGNVTINGNSTHGRGVALAGTITAGGTLNITGTADDSNAIATGTLTLSAAGGATLTGTADAANAINVSGLLDATGTPSLTLNGTSTGGDTVYGVRVPGTLNAASLTINGHSLSASDDTGGVLVSGTVTAANDMIVNGTANAGTGVNVSGVLNATGGNLTINGGSETSRAVRLAGTVAASGTVTVTANANGAGAALGIADTLILAAAGGAILTGTANGANGINISGALDATATPNLTLNGTATSGDDFYGVKIAGTVNASNLAINGRGVSAIDDVGGSGIFGTVTASRDLVINGNASAGTGVNVTGTVNATGGNVTIIGGSTGDRGVRLGGMLAASGSVTVNGTAQTLAGIGVERDLVLVAQGGATFNGSATLANGINVSANLNATGTPLLTLNGTTTANGSSGGLYGVNVSGDLIVGNLAVNGIGNLSALGNIGGTAVTGNLNATGNVTLNGQTGGLFSGVFVDSRMTVGGTVVLNGSGKLGYGVNATNTLNAGGGVTITGMSDSNVGVFVGGNLTLPGSQGATLNGTTNTGQAGVLFNGSRVTGSGPLTVNANLITLNNASFRGTGTVVLQALDSASPLTVSGSGADFGNVASVMIGSTSQAADLNLAAALTYAGAGNLSVVTGMANIALNANIDASAGSGSVILSAGNGVPINASQSNGNVTGGDVLLGNVTSLAAGEGGTVVIYSGNANSAAYAALVANGAASQTKTYATLAGEGDVSTASALNLFYRVAPSLTVTLGNATGANVTKTYDGVGVALGYSVTGMIDGDSAASVALTGNLAASAPLTDGQAMHAANYTVSQGNATFTSDSHYAVSVANGSIVITPKALTVTATSDTKVFDGTTGSNATMTVCGTIAGDSFSTGALGEVFASAAVAGANNSILLPAAPLSNASFASSTAGSWIGDYSVTYVAALGTILPTNGGSTVVIVPPTQTGGLASADVVSLGSWLNSGGQQQNLPPGLAMNDNVLHLMFSTSSGQPIIQASWAAFNSNYSGTINLPANANPPP